MRGVGLQHTSQNEHFIEEERIYFFRTRKHGGILKSGKNLVTLDIRDSRFKNRQVQAQAAACACMALITK